ncbi:hypothetical protein WJ542_17430 [Paraburkholderia sp. B3]|uniref:hypothetical protein n=1 Tax=Paraburkholderia sp. B3 TaxID=3134791 RepID=UPI003981E881
MINSRTLTPASDTRYYVQSTPSWGSAARQSGSPTRVEDFEVIHRHTVEEVEGLQKKIERLDAEIAQAQVDRQAAEIKVHRLAALIEELRGLKAGVPAVGMPQFGAEPAIMPSQRPRESSRFRPGALLIAIAVVLIAVGLFAAFAYDGTAWHGLAGYCSDHTDSVFKALCWMAGTSPHR